MTSQSLVYSLPRFEGPLDLLLALVRRNGVEITDIPIADITRQYLDYLRDAERLDLNLASEFAYMASTLIQIKVRCLLPADPELIQRDGDPRQEVIRQLMDHEHVLQAAKFLENQLEVLGGVQVRSAVTEQVQDTKSEAQAPITPGSLNLVEILQLAKQALETAQTYNLIAPQESATVEEMSVWLEQRLGDGDYQLDGQTLLAEQCSVDRQIALFLALLELAKAARVRLHQKEPLGTISILAFRPESSHDTTVP